MKEKLLEAVRSVLPITMIVALLSFTIAPLPTDLMLSFVIGTALLILGLGLFSFGSEASVTRMGAHIGSRLTRTRRVAVILLLSLTLGVIVTVAEPDLQVLAVNVPHIDTMVLIIAVSLGVGFFLTVSMIRILLGISLRWLFLLFYAVIFLLAAYADPEYLSVAFDSGGVTTGPMTAPFIIALGVGVAAIRSDRRAEEDSFGLVGLCSIGQVLAVLVLGFFYRGEGGDIDAAEPAVHVLNAQVEEISAGAVSKRSMHIALSIAIAAAMGLSVLRILYGIPILYFVLPGYALALLLSFFVPGMFTAIAFDAGGGTVLHAKGTGAKLAQKFLGVTLAEEKEIILIAASKEGRSAIMTAVAQNCGVESKAGAISFSLQVSEIVGLRRM